MPSSPVPIDEDTESQESNRPMKSRTRSDAIDEHIEVKSEMEILQENRLKDMEEKKIIWESTLTELVYITIKRCINYI